MSYRKFLFSACLLLAGLLTANAVFAQAYSFRVTDGMNPDPDAPQHFALRPFIGLPDLKAGEPFLARVEVLDVDGERVTNYSQDVTLEIRARLLDQTTRIVVPAFEFVDGVAVVEVTSIYAGVDNMRFWVTDGNIITDDASSIFIPGVHSPIGFSVQPAGFDVTYVGGNRSLDQNVILDNVPVWARVRALNANGTVASAWRGWVMLRGQTLEGSWEAYVGPGGISDYDHSNPSSLVLSFDLDGAGPVSETLEASIDDGDTWEQASATFNVVERGTNASDVTVDRHELVGGAQPHPGQTRAIRYRLNNDGDSPTFDPIDIYFEMVDPSDNNAVLAVWTEQYAGAIEEGDDSPELITQFTLPANLLGDRSYTVRIRPDNDIDRQETVEIGMNTNPDLAVVGFEYAPGEYRGGDAMRFQLAFANLATDGVVTPSRPTSAVPHNQSYKLQLHLSTNAIYGDSDDFLVWQGTFTGNGEGDRFLPGQRIDVTGDFMLPDNFDGTFYLFARINSHSDDTASAAGRDGSGFQPESRSPSVPSNNTTAPRISQRLTILPRQATETFRVSLSAAGGSSGGNSDNAVMSADGHYVAFESLGSLAGNTGNVRNIFVRDVNGANTVLASVGLSNLPANGHSGNPSISADGRQVVFQSSASNLVSQNMNGFSGVYVRDVQTSTTTALSVNPWTNQPGNHGSQLASISNDGRFVVFESGATNLLHPDDPAASGLVLGRRQVYLYDRSVDGSSRLDAVGNTAITLVSRNGSQPAQLEAVRPRISGDGKVVTFVTHASNILSADPHFAASSSPFPQIVRWNRENNRMTVVSVERVEDPLDPSAPTTFALGNNISGYAAINGDGEYIAFASRAQNLTDDNYNESIPHVFRARIHNDVVVEMRRMNTWDDNEPNNTRFAFTPVLGAYEPALSQDGQMLAFTSESTNLLPPIPVRNVDRTQFESYLVHNYYDDNWAADVYLFDLADPDAPGIRRASVSSFGYGTTRRNYTADTVVMEPPASRRPAISPDGRFVAFTSATKGHQGLLFGATNYIYEATNGNLGDIYVFDLKERASTPRPSPGTLPTASLLLPAAGSEIGSNSSWPMVANVRPGSSDIIEVSFYAMSTTFGTTYLGQAQRQAPSDNYVFTYSNSLIAGDYNIVVAVRDENGNYVSSAPVPITIRNATQSNPSLQLTGPANGESLAVDSNIILSARASHNSGNITRVDFYANGNLVGSDQGGGIVIDPDDEGAFWWNDSFSYSMGRTFVSSWSASVPGNYAVLAVAHDEFGNVVASDTHVITVQNQVGHAPSVAIIQPTGGVFSTSATSGSSIAITAEAYDPDGHVTLLEIFANGTLVESRSNPGHTLTGIWEIPHVPGVHQIYAVATDNDGNRKVSAPVSISVRLPTFDGPGIQLITPTDGDRFTDQTPIALTAIAGHDTANVSRVDFFANGQQVGSSARFPWLGMPDDFEFSPFFPWAFGSTFMSTWTPTGPGTYEIIAVALDEHGNRKASEIHTVVIEPRGPSRPPRALLRQPVQNSALTDASVIRFMANGFDSDGDFRGIQFYVNGVPYGDEQLRDSTVLNNAEQPYSIAWSPPQPGIYVIHAVATDTSGNRSMSEARVVTSTTGDESKAPKNVTIFRNSAGVGRELNTGSYVFLQATAESPAGVIERVQFFMNGQSIGQSSEAPHTARVGMPRTGLYEFYAVAYDDRNNIVSSDPIHVSIRPPMGALPDIGMVYPVTPIDTTTKSRFPVVAVASDVDQNTGTHPLEVEFFLDRGQHAIAEVSGIDDDTGAIEDIDVDDEGFGYTFAPDVIIVGDGEEASAFAVMVPGPGGLVVDEVIVTNGGRNYTWAQVLFSGGGVFVAQPIGKGIQEHQSTFYRLEDKDPEQPGFGFEGRGTGAYRFYGVAADNDGNQRRSPFQVFENDAVIVGLSASEPPTNLRLNISGGVIKDGRRHFQFNEVTSLSVRGDDLDGRIEEVEFFFNGVSLNALENSPNPVEAAPWQYSGAIIVAGDWNVFALVTDNTGVTAMTKPHWITVGTPKEPTAQIIGMPSEAYVGMPLTINVDAQAGVGTVREVQIYVNNEPLEDGLLTSPPYRFRWTPQGVGQQSISARIVNSFDQVSHSDAVGINIMPLGVVIGDPSLPGNHASFVSQSYFDLLGRAPRLVELQTFVNELTTGGRTRGDVIAKILTDREYDLVPWVIVAYLTALGDFPTVEQLEDGLAVLRSLPEDFDEDDLSIIPGAPFGLTLVVAQALASDEFWFKFSQRGNQMHPFELLDIVWERNLGRSWTASRKLEAQEEMLEWGRNIYIAQLAAESFRSFELRARLGSLVLLLLDRDTSHAEVSELQRRFGSNIAKAADFIVSLPEYGQRFPNHQGTFFGHVTGRILGAWDEETKLFVKHSDWFGTFNDTYFDWVKMKGWLRHKEHGWIYVVVRDNNPKSMWMWDYIQQDWLWTRGDIYGSSRILYSHDRQKWIYVRPNGNPEQREIRVYNGSWGPWIIVQPQ